MTMCNRRLFSILAVSLAALATAALTVPAAHAADGAELPAGHGAYLVNLLGCGRCHTEGYLTGERATGPHLAGSTIGIAYTAYRIDEEYPGVVFPSNLTGDEQTGLGAWSKEDIVRAMSRGIARSGHERLTVMPWGNYNALTAADLDAIATYLKTLPAVSREIPRHVPEGEPTEATYIRFGVYRFTPHWHLGTDPDVLTTLER